jgi:hypothetical protein
MAFSASRTAPPRHRAAIFSMFGERFRREKQRLDPHGLGQTVVARWPLADQYEQRVAPVPPNQILPSAPHHPSTSNHMRKYLGPPATLDPKRREGGVLIDRDRPSRAISSEEESVEAQTVRRISVVQKAMR